MTYEEQLNDPSWHVIRDFVKILAGDCCALCGDQNNLEVHHIKYIPGKMAWEYPVTNFKCLCHACHRKVTEKSKDLPPFTWIHG